MKNLRAAFVLGLFALTACGGGTTSSGVVPGSNQPSTGGPATGTMGGDVVRKPVRKYGRVMFWIKVPARHASVAAPAHGMRPNFISPSATSISVTLVSVNSGPPPAGLSTVVTTNLSGCSSGCNVVGPYAPVGSDVFDLAIFDGTNGSGNEIETGSTTITVVAGQANSQNVTMEGIPHTFVLSGSMPAGTGGTAFANAAGLQVNVEDADANVILGTYAQPVTITDADVASLTLASGLTLTGAAGSCASPASQQVLHSSTDASNLALCYGGMDIVPAAITGTTSIVTTPVSLGNFSPTVQAIQYTGPLNGGNAPEADLYVANGPSGGTGSFVAWTDTQTGWTNAPYSQAVTETDNCDSSGNLIGTFAVSGSPSGTAWQANALASPTVGTCTMTMHGGGAATLGVITTYTSTSVGVNFRRTTHVGTVTGKSPTRHRH